MSKNRYLATIPFPSSKSYKPQYREPDIHSLLDILRDHGYRLSRIEERIEDLVTNGTSSRLLSDDPPCEICGHWTSHGILCPYCETRYPWY